MLATALLLQNNSNLAPINTDMLTSLFSTTPSANLEAVAQAEHGGAAAAHVQQ